MVTAQLIDKHQGALLHVGNMILDFQVWKYICAPLESPKNNNNVDIVNFTHHH